MTDSPSPALWKLAETADKVRLLQEIDRLSEQVDYWRKKAQSLERELHKEVRTARERPFGNDTPSSKQLFRPDAPEAKVARKGGAKPGHDGHGRRCAGEEDADEVVELAMPTECDRCGGELEDFKVEERSVRVAVPAHYRNLHYVVRTGWCAKCNRQVKERVPGVLPRFAASNSLLAQNVMDRYVYGMTVGTISARTGLSKSAILSEDERLSEILKPCTDRLLELYRKSPVKGADETTWSCDGLRGYVYGFFTDDIALFRFRGTRRKFVAEDVFGPGERHFGVLVRDRYSAYDNSFRGRQQYCFEHLKRDCLELLEKEPENREYLKFVPKFVDLLREASEHSGFRAFEHSSIYSLRCSQAQMPKCFPHRRAGKGRGTPEVPGHLPATSRQNLPMGRGQARPGGEQHVRARSQAHGHRQEDLRRIAERGRAHGARGSAVRDRIASSAVRRSRCAAHGST